MQLILAVGPNKVAQLANRVGVTRIDPNKSYGMSLTLGAYEVSPLDMAAGYATFANHGVKADATPVMKITMADGTVLEDNTGPRGHPGAGATGGRLDDQHPHRPAREGRHR